LCERVQREQCDGEKEGGQFHGEDEQEV
jgi:hypothetical protein